MLLSRRDGNEWWRCTKCLPNTNHFTVNCSHNSLLRITAARCSCLCVCAHCTTPMQTSQHNCFVIRFRAQTHFIAFDRLNGTTNKNHTVLHPIRNSIPIGMNESTMKCASTSQSVIAPGKTGNNVLAANCQAHAHVRFDSLTFLDTLSWQFCAGDCIRDVCFIIIIAGIETNKWNNYNLSWMF